MLQILVLKMWPHYIVISFKTFSKFKEGQFQQCLVFYTLFLNKIQGISRLLILKMRIHLGVLWLVPLFFHILMWMCLNQRMFWSHFQPISLIFLPKPLSRTQSLVHNNDYSKSFFKIVDYFVMSYNILFYFDFINFILQHITFL